MANVLFSRTSDPSSKPITDGQLIFDTSGNGKMYLDNGTERLEMGGSMSVDSVLNAESTNPIQNKAVAGVMLKTLNEVGAVTKAGFIPDALTVKQLNSNLSEIEEKVSKGWKLIGSTTGSTHIQLPSDFEMLFINSLGESVMIPKSCLTNTEQAFYNGMYLGTSTNHMAQFMITDSYAYLYRFYINGTDKASTSAVSVYCK